MTSLPRAGSKVAIYGPKVNSEGMMDQDNLEPIIVLKYEVNFPKELKVSWGQFTSIVQKKINQSKASAISVKAQLVEQSIVAIVNTDS